MKKDLSNNSNYTLSLVASPNKGDRRSRRTDMLLQKTLVELLQTKNLSEINVTELTEKADLSRTTFYLHYDNIEQLYRQLEENLYQQFNEILNESFKDTQPLKYVVYTDEGKATIPLISIICRTIKENPLLSPTVLNDPNGQILNRIYTAGYTIFLENVRKLFPNIKDNIVKYHFTFLVSGVVGTIITWLHNDLAEDTNYIIDLLTEYTLTHLQQFEETLVSGRFNITE